jgi:hypothetical protein
VVDIDGSGDIDGRQAHVDDPCGNPLAPHIAAANHAFAMLHESSLGDGQQPAKIWPYPRPKWAILTRKRSSTHR